MAIFDWFNSKLEPALLFIKIKSIKRDEITSMLFQCSSMFHHLYSQVCHRGFTLSILLPPAKHHFGAFLHYQNRNLIPIWTSYNYLLGNSLTLSATPILQVAVTFTPSLYRQTSRLFADHLNLSPVLTLLWHGYVLVMRLARGVYLIAFLPSAWNENFLRLEMNSDRGAAFWYLDNLKCLGGWRWSINDAEQSRLKQDFKELCLKPVSITGTSGWNVLYLHMKNVHKQIHFPLPSFLLE